MRLTMHDDEEWPHDYRLPPLSAAQWRGIAGIVFIGAAWVLVLIQAATFGGAYDDEV